MNITRKLAGYLLIAGGLLFILLHVLAVEGSDMGGLPTFLGIGVIFLLFGILTTAVCLMGEKECDVEAP